MDSKKEPGVEQPIQFNHAKHLRYFQDGTHKGEKIKWHLKAMDETEVPSELAEGKCLECHGSFEETRDCGGCHLVFQDERVAKNRSQRPCLGCHRTAWTDYQAGIPTIRVCKNCHSEELRTASEHEQRLRKYILEDKDIPWIQVNSMVDHVHFSHVNHIRFAGISCRLCHPQDMGLLSAPPEKVLEFTMEFCMDCHELSNARNDCLACHK